MDNKVFQFAKSIKFSRNAEATTTRLGYGSLLYFFIAIILDNYFLSNYSLKILVKRYFEELLLSNYLQIIHKCMII